MSPQKHLDEYAATAAFYDYVTPYRERSDVTFFVEAAQASRGPVLEIGCGTGRILIPTARAGIPITGLDLSIHMLEICRKKVAEEPTAVQNRINLVEGDMRHFSIEGQFALVTLPFRPFQHLITTDDQIACLKNIHQHLQPNGQLILDIFNPNLEALVKGLGELHADASFTLEDGCQVVRSVRIADRDYFRQVSQVEFFYDVTHPDGRQERATHQFEMRYLFRYEAEHLLARCGFEIENLYADYDKSPFGSRYPGELLFVARKPGP